MYADIYTHKYISLYLIYTLNNISCTLHIKYYVFTHTHIFTFTYVFTYILIHINIVCVYFRRQSASSFH